MKIEDLHKQGWTIKEIAAETLFSPLDGLQTAMLRQGSLTTAGGGRRTDGAEPVDPTRPPLVRGPRRWSRDPRQLGFSVDAFSAEGLQNHAMRRSAVRTILGPRFAERGPVDPATREGRPELIWNWCQLMLVLGGRCT